MRFKAFGHENVRATHATTLEITRASALTPHGDCIIAVKADFDPLELERFARAAQRLRLTLEADGIRDAVVADVNHAFKPDDEIVIRLGEHVSERTLGTRADKAAKHLDRALIARLKHPDTEVTITIEEAAE